MDELDIIGVPPELKDRKLEELLVQSFWFDGQLEEEANVIFLKVDGAWFQLCFDYGIIFWSSDSEQPKPYKFQNDDGTWSEFSTIDLGYERGLKERKIEDYSMHAIEGGSRVVIQLEGNRTVGFECIEDDSKIIAQPVAGGDATRWRS